MKRKLLIKIKLHTSWDIFSEKAGMKSIVAWMMYDDFIKREWIADVFGARGS